MKQHTNEILSATSSTFSCQMLKNLLGYITEYKLIKINSTEKNITKMPNVPLRYNQQCKSWPIFSVFAVCDLINQFIHHLIHITACFKLTVIANRTSRTTAWRILGHILQFLQTRSLSILWNSKSVLINTLKQFKFSYH